MPRWLMALTGIVLLAGTIGTVAVVVDPDDHRGDEITRIENADGGETIIIRDERPRFVPFGFLLFPIAIVGTILLVKALVFGGGRGPGGPFPPGGRQRWLDEWHRAAHADSAPTSEPSSSARS